METPKDSCGPSKHPLEQQDTTPGAQGLLPAVLGMEQKGSFPLEGLSCSLVIPGRSVPALTWLQTPRDAVPSRAEQALFALAGRSCVDTAGGFVLSLAQVWLSQISAGFVKMLLYAKNFIHWPQSLPLLSPLPLPLSAHTGHWDFPVFSRSFFQEFPALCSHTANVTQQSHPEPHPGEFSSHNQESHGVPGAPAGHEQKLNKIQNLQT